MYVVLVKLGVVGVLTVGVGGGTVSDAFACFGDPCPPTGLPHEHSV